METDPLLMPFTITGVFFTKYNNTYSGFYVEPAEQTKLRHYLKPVLISGLGIPQPNVRMLESYRMDGAYFSGLNIPSRSVILSIPVTGDVQAKRAELFRTFSHDPAISRYTCYDLNLELSNNVILSLHKVVLVSITEELHGPRGQFLALTFLASDPWFYNTTVRQNTWEHTGGFQWDVDQEFDLDIMGTGIAYPTIEVTGVVYLLRVLNMHTHQEIGPLYLQTMEDEVITIVTDPLQERGVFSNIRGNIISHVGSNYESASLDFYLDPGFGANRIRIIGTAYGTLRVVTTWYDSYLGV